MSLFIGTWDGRNELGNFEWHGSFELVGSENFILNGNTVAGSERAAYRINGERCSDSAGYITNGKTTSSLMSILFFHLGNRFCLS